MQLHDLLLVCESFFLMRQFKFEAFKLKCRVDKLVREGDILVIQKVIFVLRLVIIFCQLLMVNQKVFYELALEIFCGIRV